MKKIIISLVLCSLLFSPVFASAQTIPVSETVRQQLIQTIISLINQLEAQVQQILAQQASIQSSLNQIPQTPPPTPPITAPAPVSAPEPSNITIVENPAYTDQVIAPNTSSAEIGSFIVTNNSDIPATISEADVLLNIGNFYFGEDSNGLLVPTIQDFMGLYIQIPSEKKLDSIAPRIQNAFQMNETLAPSQSEEFDVFTNSGSASGAKVTIQTTLTIDGASAVGQTITFSK